MKPFFLFCSIFFIYSCVFNKEITPPNIIFILTDDQGYGDLGIYGATDIETPYIDQLASEALTVLGQRLGADRGIVPSLVGPLAVLASPLIEAAAQILSFLGRGSTKFFSCLGGV